jgi:hypothetical protein
VLVFNDKEKWHQWQNDISKKLFHETGVIQEPDPRKIIFL